MSPCSIGRQAGQTPTEVACNQEGDTLAKAQVGEGAPARARMRCPTAPRTQ